MQAASHVVDLSLLEFPKKMWRSRAKMKETPVAARNLTENMKCDVCDLLKGVCVCAYVCPLNHRP